MWVKPHKNGAFPFCFSPFAKGALLFPLCKKSCKTFSWSSKQKQKQKKTPRAFPFAKKAAKLLADSQKRPFAFAKTAAKPLADPPPQKTPPKPRGFSLCKKSCKTFSWSSKNQGFSLCKKAAKLLADPQKNNNKQTGLLEEENQKNVFFLGFLL